MRPRVGALAGEGIPGDKDPLDICVFSERPIARSEVLMSARVIGGLRMIDGGEADDKIIAVLASDNLWGHARELQDLPHVMVERLVHYFSTYKWVPGQAHKVDIQSVYKHEQAYDVIKAAHADYLEHFNESDLAGRDLIPAIVFDLHHAIFDTHREGGGRFVSRGSQGFAVAHIESGAMAWAGDDAAAHGPPVRMPPSWVQTSSMA